MATVAPQFHYCHCRDVASWTVCCYVCPSTSIANLKPHSWGHSQASKSVVMVIALLLQSRAQYNSRNELTALLLTLWYYGLDWKSSNKKQSCNDITSESSDNCHGHLFGHFDFWSDKKDPSFLENNIEPWSHMVVFAVVDVVVVVLRCSRWRKPRPTKACLHAYWCRQRYAAGLAEEAQNCRLSGAILYSGGLKKEDMNLYLQPSLYTCSTVGFSGLCTVDP